MSRRQDLGTEKIKELGRHWVQLVPPHGNTCTKMPSSPFRNCYSQLTSLAFRVKVYIWEEKRDEMYNGILYEEEDRAIMDQYY
jgi:hypothetical protein